MLSALIMANGNLGSDGFLRWRFLALLVHQDQKTLCRDFFFPADNLDKEKQL